MSSYRHMNSYEVLMDANNIMAALPKGLAPHLVNDLIRLVESMTVHRNVDDGFVTRAIFRQFLMFLSELPIEPSIPFSSCIHRRASGAVGDYADEEASDEPFVFHDYMKAVSGWDSRGAAEIDIPPRAG